MLLTYEITAGEAIISTGRSTPDVGSSILQYTNQEFNYLYGLGTIGYGLGACVGAKVGMPDKQ